MSGWPVTIRVAGLVLDRCRVALPVEVTHGRSQVLAQPDAPTLQFGWIGSTPPGAVGDPVVLTEDVGWSPAVYDSATVDYDDSAAVYDDDGTGVTARARFVGNIAALSAREVDGDVASWQVDCVGALARLGFAPVTLTRPQEDDVTRITRICIAAGVPVRIRGVDTLLLAAKDIDGDALSALHDVCTSSGGLVWQSPDGTLNYGTADHREHAETLGVLPCEAIAAGLTWDEAVESIINDVTVTSETGGTASLNDPDSVTEAWGVRHVDVGTDCATITDVSALAAVIIKRRAWPYWGTPQAVVHGHKLTAEDARLVAALDVSSAVMAPFDAEPGAVPSGPAPAMVEGWVEQWADRHTIQVALSDSARWVTTRARTYTEALALGTYADMLAHGSYVDVLVMEGV